MLVLGCVEGPPEVGQDDRSTTDNDDPASATLDMGTHDIPDLPSGRDWGLDNQPDLPVFTGDMNPTPNGRDAGAQPGEPSDAGVMDTPDLDDGRSPDMMPNLGSE